MGLLLPVAVLLLQMGGAVAEEANPLRSVITMLQMMKKKVEEEGKTEAQLFDKYMCFCNTGLENLRMSITKGEKKVPQLAGDVQSGKQGSELLSSELKQAQDDRDKVRDKIAKAKELRMKDEEAYAKESGETKANIQALGKATTALAKGAEVGFLQSPAADKLRRLVKSPRVDAEKSEVLSVFLATEAGSAYAPDSDQIIGICKTLKTSMEQQLAEIEQQEKEAVRDYEQLVAASEKELKTITLMIEAKMDRRSRQEVANVQREEDLDASTEALEKDSIFFKDTKEKCTVISTTYREHRGYRSEELVTLADAIAIMTNDDSLETIKKATNKDAPAAAMSFLQVRAVDRRREALKLLRMTRRARRGRVSAQMDLLELALRGRDAGFGKVIKLIDGMADVLDKEQAGDDKKAKYCRKEFDETEDSMKQADEKIGQAAKSIKDQQGVTKTLEEELHVIVQSIAISDKMVGEATVARKGNNAAYVDLMNSNRAALQIIEVAEKRLLKFYNKRLAEFVPAEHELADEGQSQSARVTLNPNQNGPGAMTLLRGMTGVLQVSETDGDEGVLQGPYKKNQASAGVLEMLNTIKADIARDSLEAEIEEKNHRASYQLTLRDAGEKRAVLAKTLTEKEAARSAIVEDIERFKADKKVASKEAKELQMYMANLHEECDWLLKDFDVRKEAREAERDALMRSQDVLRGAKA